MLAYEQLDAWKSTHALVLALYEALPPSAQRAAPHAAQVARLHRSALRAVGRIAFGSGTRSRGMFRRAAERAAGHRSEFAYQLAIAQARGVVPAHVAERLAALRGRASFYTWQLLDTLLPKGSAGESDR